MSCARRALARFSMLALTSIATTSEAPARTSFSITTPRPTPKGRPHSAEQTLSKERPAVLVNLMRDLHIGPLIDECGEIPGPEASRCALSVHAALSSAYLPQTCIPQALVARCAHGSNLIQPWEHMALGT